MDQYLTQIILTSYRPTWEIVLQRNFLYTTVKIIKIEMNYLQWKLALYFVKFAANLYAWIVSFYLLEIMWNKSAYNSNNSDIVYWSIWEIVLGTELPLYNSEYNQHWTELATMNLTLYFVKFAANLYAWILSFYLLEIMWNKSVRNSNNSDIVYTGQYGRSFIWERNFLYTTVNIINIELN